MFAENCMVRDFCILEGLSILAHGHVDLVLAGLANRVQLLLQELDKLGLLLLGDLGQAVDNDKVVIALVESNLVLLAQVGDVDLILIELVIVEVGLAEVVEGRSWRRHAGWLLGESLRCRRR